MKSESELDPRELQSAIEPNPLHPALSKMPKRNVGALATLLLAISHVKKRPQKKILDESPQVNGGEEIARANLLFGPVLGFAPAER